MQSYDIIHMRFFHAASLHHGKCASCSLLCWLEKELHTPGPLCFTFPQDAGRTQSYGYMGIMAAGMHKAGIHGSVRAGRILRQRQGIHVSPQGHRVSPARSAALNHGCNPRACYRIFVGNAPSVQQPPDTFTGPFFFKPRFRMAVEIPADLHQLRVYFFYTLFYIHTINLSKDIHHQFPAIS